MYILKVYPDTRVMQQIMQLAKDTTLIFTFKRWIIMQVFLDLDTLHFIIKEDVRGHHYLLLCFKTHSFVHLIVKISWYFKCT